MMQQHGLFGYPKMSAWLTNLPPWCIKAIEKVWFESISAGLSQSRVFARRFFDTFYYFIARSFYILSMVFSLTYKISTPWKSRVYKDSQD